MLWLFFQTILAIEVDFENPGTYHYSASPTPHLIDTLTDSIKAGASTLAHDLMTYYTGNLTGQVPGLLPQPYYWWEAGALFGAMINYWHYTGDDTYNPVTTQALLFQVGPHNDYMPPNQTSDMGNDDQAFWGMAALAAAEFNFPNPDPEGGEKHDQTVSWLGLAQAVFNEQVGRWDDKTCGGGLRWQVYVKGGYNLKNTISNGCLFNIAARLARYTNDDMYAQWAVKLWDWMWDIGLIGHDYSVYDNSEADQLNCTQIDRNRWSYNVATLLMGASTMFNYVRIYLHPKFSWLRVVNKFQTNGDPIWQNRTQNLLTNAAGGFFPNGIMKEGCEDNVKNPCNVDQRSFKAYLSRWMAATTQMAPFTYDTAIKLLTSSAKAAVAQCVGGDTGRMCGLKWDLNGTWDGTNGVGESLDALEVVLGTLIQEVKAPVTNTTGGTSQGDPTAGFNSTAAPPGSYVEPPGKGDKVGAWVVTGAMVVFCVFAMFFMMSTAWEPREARSQRTISEKEKVILDLKGKRSSAERGSVAVLETVGEEERGVP